MPELRLRGLTVTPPGAARPVVHDVDLTVGDGERVLLAGPSGAGKSTVLRALAGLLDDDLDADGEVLLDGRPAEPGEIGYLVQDPLDAVVARTAGRDTAFGPENSRVDRPGIWRKVARAHAAARYTAGRDREVSTLSGGERQRLALAGTLALEPAVLLLDEPTSMLDAPTATQVRAAVLDAARGRSLVVVDHDVAGWTPHVDRVVRLDRDGRITDPEPTQLVDPVLPATLLHTALSCTGELLHGSDIGLLRGGLQVLRGLDVGVDGAAVTAVTGPSGAGKSSLLAVLAGLVRPTGRLLAADGFAPSGRPAPHRWTSREVAARIGWVPQFPEHTFVGTTVAAEVAVTPSVLGRSAVRGGELLEELGLTHRADVNPFRLSGGEQRRLALAAALAAGPALVLVDEPTVGQDPRTWAAVTGLLLAAARDGAGVVVSTHDERLLQVLGPRRVLRPGAAREVAA